MASTVSYSAVERVALDGTWEFGEAGADQWLSGTVPGGVYHDLFEAGEIPDPFVEDNELDVQWVGKTNWDYRTTFDVDEEFLAHDEHRLDCKGVDTFAEIYVNGDRVGETENMHRRYQFDVGAALEPGENEIRVSFQSPVETSTRKQADVPYEIPAISFPVEQPGRNHIRKAQCHYGWDWGPCLPTMGIWESMDIVAFSTPRITYVTTRQTHREDEVELVTTVGFDVPEAGAYDVSVSVAGEEVTESVDLERGEDRATLTTTIPDPDLWWPAGYGDQPLYDLEVSVSDASGSGDAVTDRIGFRKLELVREQDEAGESFAFEVNDVPVYAKGANWIPTDGVPGRVTADDYDELLESAVAANMNMIRVWGGGIYEKDAFYERADELGLLVWQDFMFACSLYPADEEFLANVEAEARHQVRRLANHPSIALWCGNNENEEALTDWFGDREHADQLKTDYEALYLDTLETVVEEEDPSRSYWPSSPSSGGDYDPDDPTRGDVHYWEVWHEGKPFDDYLDAEPRFSSEFGYQSFPSTQTLSTVLDEDQFNPTAPLMEHHQRHPEGNSQILSRMADHFRFPFDFEDFVYLSQVQQGLAMKTAIEHWRRLKPHCMGTLYWQLNDIWPVASWSSIEYGGRWKALHYMAKRFYAPVLVSTEYDKARDEMEVWVTSDVTHELDDVVELDVVTFDGERVYEDEISVSLEPLESEPIATIDPDEIGVDDRDEVVIRAEYAGDEESYPQFAFFDVYKRLALPETAVSADVDGTDVTVAADDIALYVRLDAANLDGHFSDNYFHLAPGETRTVTFEPAGEQDGTLEENLSVTHLRETY